MLGGFIDLARVVTGLGFYWDRAQRTGAVRDGLVVHLHGFGVMFPILFVFGLFLVMSSWRY